MSCHLPLLSDIKLQWKPFLVNDNFSFDELYLLVDSAQSRCPIPERRSKQNSICNTLQPQYMSDQRYQLSFHCEEINTYECYTTSIWLHMFYCNAIFDPCTYKHKTNSQTQKPTSFRLFSRPEYHYMECEQYKTTSNKQLFDRKKETKQLQFDTTMFSWIYLIFLTLKIKNIFEVCLKFLWTNTYISVYSKCLVFGRTVPTTTGKVSSAYQLRHVLYM